MNQVQTFIEKVKNDNALMAKLDELGASGAGTDKIIALAAEHGFVITAADVDRMQKIAGKGSELDETELADISGGNQTNFTQNRYDPQECVKIKEVAYRCVGFLAACFCDHYKKTGGGGDHYNHSCAMGYFSYTE